MLLSTDQDLPKLMALEKKRENALEKIICSYGKHT